MRGVSAGASEPAPHVEPESAPEVGEPAAEIAVGEPA